MSDARIVWTSDPEEARRLRESGNKELRRDVEPGKQVIHVALDRKRRAGKTVTVAAPFQLAPQTLTALATSLKKRCGSGGTARGEEIELQGDHVATVKTELTRLGYRVK